MKTPILILAYNRKDKVEKLINSLKEVKPSNIYISVDGPKDANGKNEINQVINIFKTKITWDCNRFYNISDHNLGCKKGVVSGINWFFSNVQKGIILEDDCIPSESFFRFTQTLLNKYSNQKDVSIISGHSRYLNKNEEDYYLINYPMIWGWATWKDRWEKFDVNLDNYQLDDLKKVISKYPKDTQRFFISIFRLCKSNRIDTWDYPLLIHNIIEGNKSIIPKKSLIQNIGFDEAATHTKNSENENKNIIANRISFPLIHPESLEIDKKMEDNYNNKLFFKKSFFGKLKGKIYEVCFS